MFTKRAALGVVLILIVFVIGVLVWANNRTVSTPSGKIPDVSLEEFGQKLNGLRGKPVVLNFWASWCPPCREEAPDLEKTWRKYKGKVEFIGIDIQNDTIDDALKFLEEFGVTYPQVRDNTGKIAISYKITGVPETFLITKDGQQVEHIVGATTEAKLSAAIEEKLLK